MFSIIDKKPNGDTFQVFDRRTNSCQSPEIKVYRLEDLEKDEALYPTGFKKLSDGSIETPLDRQLKLNSFKKSHTEKRKNTDEALYPLGVKIEG